MIKAAKNAGLFAESRTGLTDLVAKELKGDVPPPLLMDVFQSKRGHLASYPQSRVAVEPVVSADGSRSRRVRSHHPEQPVRLTHLNRRACVSVCVSI